MKINTSRAEKAEHEAKRAKKDASMTEAIAGRIKLQIEACIHTIKVKTDIIKELSKKADTESEAVAKYQQVEALAVDTKRRVIDKKKEGSTEGKCFRRIASEKQAEAKVAKTAYEIDAAKSAAQDAEAKALRIETEVKELELLMRKVTSDLKRAKIEVEEAKGANVLRIKHSKSLAEAESEMQIKKAEFECRQAAAHAKNALVQAKKAEAKAINAGDTTQAEARRLEAKIHKAGAIVKDNEVKELKRTVKPKSKSISQKPISPASQLPKEQARCVEKNIFQQMVC